MGKRSVEGTPSPRLLPQAPGTCVSGPGQVLGWQDFLQAPLESLSFRELRYLLLTVLCPDPRASSVLGFSHGPASGGGPPPGWWCLASSVWAPGAAPGILRREQT